MSELIRKPYKITLWEDKNVYIVNHNDSIIKKYELESGDIVQNQYLEEVCIATIGSDTMDTPIRAFNPILTEELNGSKTFTFQINYRYWDDEEEEFKLNPFINLLVNERKVKLKYGEEEIKYQLGDINQDGVVDTKDLSYLLYYLNGWSGYDLDAEQQILADINQDGIINGLDRSILGQNIRNGTTSSLPYIILDKKPVWYDFVIKQVDENSDSNTFTYTCKDLFINELGKTGYEVELDTELRNNMGTITELATSILKGTDWQVDEDNCDPLIQRNKEGLYSFVVPDGSQDINCTPILGGDSVTISSGQVILVFYSCKANKENPIQFLYKEQSDYSTVDEAIANFYKIDEYGFVVDADNYELTCSELGISDLDDFYDSLTSSSYFGQKIIKKQEMHYLPQIDETCLVYTHYDKESTESGNPQENQWYELDDEVYILTEDTEIDSEKEYYSNNRYYCYKELEYASVAQVQNMLSNSSGFISTNGWIGQVYLTTTTNDEVVQRTIHLDGSTYNTGFYDNRQLLSPKGFIKDEKYIVAVKGINLTNNPYIILIGKTDVTNATPLTFNKEDNDQTYSFTIPSELEGYSVKMAVCSETISYSSIINDYSDIRFYLGYSGDLIDCKVFKYRTDSTGKMIVPDLETEANTIIRTRYNFFLESSIPNNAIYTKQDLVITESLLDTTTGYEPVMIDGCKKVTSITGSKSNRFNLIQSLCEAFECWAKFTIEHNDKGQIEYKYVSLSEEEYVEGGRYYQRIEGSGESSNDSLFKIYKGTGFINGLYKKVYSKYVTFKEYIGDDNPVGFRYGINLSSIQRNIISDQIASKVIVQANSNEFAPNGSCTIQQSVLNPTGENALYNFQYFINHGLLDATSLYDDLYGTNGGLGFYTKMKEYNDSIQPKINELSEISKSLYTLSSRQTVYDALMEEADRLYEDASLELNSAGYSSTTGTVPTYVTELRKQMDSYQSTITYYSSLSTRNRNLLNAYTQKYNTISEQLVSVRKLKDKLNQDFANKYYRFIQEGTWNSEDYWDPELYYQAANMVLYTSSFPQVSYSINVLEISEIEGFEAYKFKIADKTYIEDTEFFGYDSKGRPYKEEIVVSQVTRHLDDNSQNTITVQNYKTQFQDLFQRIAATSQSLQYHEGAYQRAASAINSDGTINSALLQNSLEANALVIQNANNQSVTWDETGITISNFVNANELVRLTSKGIVLSSNGGKDWTTGITGDGINADVITAGRIDTDRIRIFNKAMQQTFEWNSTGINAYMQGGRCSWTEDDGNGNSTTYIVDLDTNQVNYGKFVRFDHYGLYGYAGGDPTWIPNNISDVISNSNFSLTWKGLNIKTGAQGGFTKVVADPSENPSAQMWYEFSSNQYVLTDDTEVENGKIYYKSDNEVINVNDKFKVDGQGNVIATSGNFTGEIHATSGSFTGEIHATSGSFTGEIYATNAIFDTIDASKVTVDGESITGNTGKIQSDYLNLYGINVTKNGSPTFSVGNDGTVTINGKITMGAGSTIAWGDGSSINTTGTSPYATTSALSSVSTTASTASSNVSKLANGTYSGGTFISGTTVKSPKLQGGTVEILNSSSSRVGYLSMGTASNNGYALTLYSDYALRMSASSGAVYITNSSGTDILIQNSNIALGGTVSIGGAVTIEGNIKINGNVSPSSTKTYSLGYSNYLWTTVYAQTGTINTSDREEKTDINYDLSYYENLIKSLKPVSYKFKDGYRTHLGFIAQDIEDSLNDNNINSKEFAGFIKDYDETQKKYIYGLRYTEFIALQQWQIQKLESRISTLENLISSQNSDIL